MKMKNFYRIYLKGLLAAGTWIVEVYVLILIVYVLNNFVIFRQAFDPERIKAQAHLRALQYHMPSLTILTLYQENQNSSHDQRLQEFAEYFGEIARYTEYPEDAYAWQGYCYYLLKKTDLAILSYQKAILLNPDIFWFHHNLGIVFYKARRYQQAVDSFNKALQTKPYVTLFKMPRYILPPLAIIYNRYLHLSNVDQMIRLSRQLAEGYDDCYQLLLASLYYLKDYEGMSDKAAQALKRNWGDKTVFYYYAGFAAFNLKRYTEAIGYFNQYLHKYPDDSKVLNDYGLAIRAMGKGDLAIRILHKAVSLEQEGKDSPFKEGDIKIRIF